MERLDRRQLLSYAAFAPVAAGAATSGAASSETASTADSSLARASKRYSMKKSINLWAFPYPSKMNLRQCLELAKRAGFEVEDVMVSFDGHTDLKREADVFAFVSQHHQPGDEVAVEVLRAGKRLHLTLPIQK